MTMAERMDRLGDRQLATPIGALLFVVAGWPVLFLRVAPYQDLPDHLATLCVLLDPGRYPEFVSNGWLKSNTLMFGLLLLFSKLGGPIAAGRALCVLVLGSTAMALPHFVLELTDRRRLLVASLFMLPMVHGWFVLMGMLAFALALPLGLYAIMLLCRQGASPTA